MHTAELVMHTPPGLGKELSNIVALAPVPEKVWVGHTRELDPAATGARVEARAA